MENSFNMSDNRLIKTRISRSNKGRKLSSFDSLVRLERAVKIAEFTREIRNKNGPVRYIVKDGQPVA